MLGWWLGMTIETLKDYNDIRFEKEDISDGVILIKITGKDDGDGDLDDGVTPRRVIYTYLFLKESKKWSYRLFPGKYTSETYKNNWYLQEQINGKVDIEENNISKFLDEIKQRIVVEAL